MATKQAFTNLADKMLNATFKEFSVPVEFLQESKIYDTQGGYDLGWVTFASADAFIFPQKGSEKIESGRLITDQLFNVHLKPLTGLNVTMKMRYKSEDYEIRSIENIAESDIWLIMTVEKGVAQ